MREALSGLLLVAGALFVLAASLGVLRFPDTYSRMHAQTKAATLGLLLVLAGAAVQVEALEGWLLLALVAAFQLLTAPVAAHLLGRAVLWRSERRAGAPDDGG